MIATAWPEYSKQAWREIVAELAVKYTDTEQRAIHTIFTGFQRMFSFDELDSRIEDLSKQSKEVSNFMDNHEIINIVRDFYRVGIIGNCTAKGMRRFAAAGYGDITFGLKVIVHEGLWPHFSLSAPKSGTRL
jgi:hypothetical protein